jgi:hypothetical protein
MPAYSVQELHDQALHNAGLPNYSFSGNHSTRNGTMRAALDQAGGL